MNTFPPGSADGSAQASPSPLDGHSALGFLLKDVTRLYTRRFELRAQALGLTLAQCKALASLSKNEGVSQKRLAELCEIDPMSLVRILDRMEADGLVQRCLDPVDRRARSLRLTEQSRPILEQVWQIAGATRGEALADLSDAERTQLVELLDRVHTNLSALEPLAEGELRADAAAASLGSVR
jgi:MarR family transcriptional regulator, transcriptional regulator for hemolysin